MRRNVRERGLMKSYLLLPLSAKKGNFFGHFQLRWVPLLSVRRLLDQLSTTGGCHQLRCAFGVPAVPQFISLSEMLKLFQSALHSSRTRSLRETTDYIITGRFI